ncbi:preprotein translocase subunit SecE [Psychrobium sp. nBUS_13]|jgi:preprotein translocase subunit SecE|uniref:preprotein translocase subunit SecE n=1 Tax=Psychrobium sp. nBUS_13 TaxID=3395319 RepID=UPI003EBA0AF1
MNATNTENQNGSMDLVKWILVIGLLAGAVVGNYMYGELSVLYRALGVVAAIGVALFVAAQTEKGREAVAFAKESRLEIRKVVWPTRKEATQTTLIVLAATGVMALVLWGLDGALVRIVGFITGIKV